MTVKEAILKALDESSQPLPYQDVTKYIIDNNLYESNGLTLNATVSAQLGGFIRKNDTRVGRIKNGRAYSYYLANSPIKKSIRLELSDKEPKDWLFGESFD